MRAASRLLTLGVVAAVGLGGAVGGFVLLSQDRGEGPAALSPPHPLWTEVRWPFPPDLWSRGKAFRCKAADCGAEVKIYLRAKLGFCNCTTGVADDADLDRMSDFDLVGGEASPVGAGRPITIGSMEGRSRAYTLTARNRPGKSAISVAFRDRCDMVVGTVVLPHDRPETIEPAVIEFLNSPTVVRWVEVALGI